MHNNGGSSLEVARRIGLAHGVMDSHHEYLALSIPVQTDKDSDLQVAGDPCLTIGHVACYPKADPAYQVVSERDNLAWRRPRGRLQSSWLRQVDVSCWESLSMGKEPAGRLGRRDRQGWRCKVDKATRPPAYAPIID